MIKKNLIKNIFLFLKKYFYVYMTKIKKVKNRNDENVLRDISRNVRNTFTSSEHDFYLLQQFSFPCSHLRCVVNLDWSPLDARWDMQTSQLCKVRGITIRRCTFEPHQDEATLRAQSFAWEATC